MDVVLSSWACRDGYHLFSLINGTVRSSLNEVRPLYSVK
jgi:hypothetical protein